VAIGASAGGIEAFRRFFTKMPPDSGLAFAVVLHLAADRKSMLRDILARWTAMPVTEATDGVALQADHVFVIPAGATAELRDGRLWLRSTARDAPRDAHRNTPRHAAPTRFLIQLPAASPTTPSAWSSPAPAMTALSG
jgi:chemotaxis response regulator CheB